MVASGRVRVNGQVRINPQLRVHPERERITVDDHSVRRPVFEYLMLNKPAGVVTTRADECGRTTVYDLPGLGGRWLAPVGRLDRASRGLLLFTNDSQWADAILAPDSKQEKVYRVRLDRAPTAAALDRCAAGVALEDGATLPARVRRVAHATEHWIEIGLTQGRNRQVRRMFAALGYGVLELVRTRIGALELGTLAEGAVRRLTPAEVRALAAKSRRRR